MSFCFLLHALCQKTVRSATLFFLRIVDANLDICYVMFRHSRVLTALCCLFMQILSSTVELELLFDDSLLEVI